MVGRGAGDSASAPWAITVSCRKLVAMPLHLLKLCVGIDTVVELQRDIASELAACRAAARPLELVHTTRMTPKRSDEVVAGGSLYWVIRGHVAARQRVRDVRPFIGADGIGRCHLVLDPTVVPVLSRPCRPFQGWRYLLDDDKPADLADQPEAEAMPETLRHALRDLCLI